MANIEINQLPAGTLPLTGNEIIPVDQGASTVQVTVDDVADFILPFAVTKAGNNTIDGNNTFNGECAFSGQLIVQGISVENELVIGESVVTTIRLGSEPGTSGQVLTSQGGAATPIWSDINAVKTIKVSLTSANILALNTTPFVLISAPGAGKILNVLNVKYRYNFVSTAYTGGGSIYCNIGGFYVTDNTQNEFALSSTATRFIKPVMVNLEQSSTSTSAYENIALSLFCTNAQLNGNGTFDVYITYNTITL